MWWDERRKPRVRDEVRFHRDRLVDDYIAAGMTREEAERRAFFEFGNVTQIEEAVRDVRGRWLEDLARDFRFTLRELARNPGFSAVAVLSLALGIGANGAIFTLINTVMLRSLPVPQPDRLVQITRVGPSGSPGFVSYPLFEHFRNNVGSVSGMFAVGIAERPIVIDGEAEFVTADLVSGSYYAVLGIEPAAGRLLGPADDEISPAAPAAVISDRFWLRRFGRSPAAIGKSFGIRDRVFTIVGATPRSFQSTRPGHAPDITLPLLTMMNDSQRVDSGLNWLSTLARLKPGETIERANAEVQVIWGAFVQAQADRAPEKERQGILRQRAGAFAAPDGYNPLRYNYAQSLVILMGIVGLVLTLACVNLSGLLLARAVSRQREISIRLAIGAGRGRLVRQFLTESLVLASLGGGIGVALAWWFSARLVTLFANGNDLVLGLAPDWRVLAFTASVSFAACLVSGIAPALQAARVTANPALKEVRAVGPRRFSQVLVIAQLAISMVLIVGATLFVGTLIKLYGVERGFDSDGLLVVTIRSLRPYPHERGPVVRGQLLERLKSMAGVQSASAAQVLPIGGGLWTRNVQVEGYAYRSDESEEVGFNAIAPGYFATLGTPLLAGREFDHRDAGAAPRVAVVNERFARYFYGDQSALGRRLKSVDATYEIVGVVRDAKYQHLRSDIMKTMYIPWMQNRGDQPASYSYVLRVVASDPMTIAPGLARLVREADPDLRLRTAVSYATFVDRSISVERIMAALGGLFGILALLIAGLGLFGVLAFQVARRTNELGVRMALGASRWAMMRLVMHDVVLMFVAGALIGGAIATTLTGVASKILFGFTPVDPAVFAVAAMVLALAAGLAGWLPARRASRVDPLVALRHE
jgi:predicted permease